MEADDGGVKLQYLLALKRNLLLPLALVAWGATMGPTRANTWKQIDVAELYLDLTKLRGVEITRIQYRLYNNERYQERARLGGRKGFFFTEYFVHTFYTPEASQRITGERFLRQRMK